MLGTDVKKAEGVLLETIMKSNVMYKNEKYIISKIQIEQNENNEIESSMYIVKCDPPVKDKEEVPTPSRRRRTNKKPSGIVIKSFSFNPKEKVLGFYTLDVVGAMLKIVEEKVYYEQDSVRGNSAEKLYFFPYGMIKKHMNPLFAKKTNNYTLGYHIRTVCDLQVEMVGVENSGIRGGMTYERMVVIPHSMLGGMKSYWEANKRYLYTIKSSAVSHARTEGPFEFDGEISISDYAETRGISYTRAYNEVRHLGDARKHGRSKRIFIDPCAALA